MNNYFGIGLDAKIALEFHHKREESADKSRFGFFDVDMHFLLAIGCL